MNVFGRVLQKNVYPIQLLFSDSVASDSVQFSDSVAVSCQKFSFFAIVCFADNQRQCEVFNFREFHSFVFFQSPRIAATPFFSHYATLDLKPSSICLFEAKIILHFSMS